MYIWANAPDAVLHAIAGLAIINIDVNITLSLPLALIPNHASWKSWKLMQSTLSNDTNTFSSKWHIMAPTLDT